MPMATQRAIEIDIRLQSFLVQRQMRVGIEKELLSSHISSIYRRLNTDMPGMYLQGSRGSSDPNFIFHSNIEFELFARFARDHFAM